jgi:hypothetical protein
VQVNTILDQIDLGAMALPEFQRGYVWNRDQVRGLMASLYRKYPVGGLLVWVTPKDTAEIRGEQLGYEGTIELLLDGQQRVTSLYGIVRGRAPRFFDGDVNTFTGLHFHLEDETFEFYAPAKMKGNSMWVSVTELMQMGAAPFFLRLMREEQLADRSETFLARLNAIDAIKSVELHIEKVTGADKTIDVVVDIFNRVNSGGTKLSKGDLALAKICAQWPDAREELKSALGRWRNHGYSFQMDWLLRNTTTVTTGEARFSSLAAVDTAQFRGGLQRAEKAVNILLNLVSSRLGLDHDRVLGGRYAFPVMTRYLTERGGTFQSAAEQDKLLFWYVHSFLWGRFTSSVESVLNQDISAIDGPNGSLDALIEQLRLSRGDLKVRPEDFAGWGLGARFYPLLYMLTRVLHARDWGSPFVELNQFLLGKGTSLQVHHVFPKAYLYKHGYYRSEVNALANFCFLTQTTNLQISDRPPHEYFPEVAAKDPGALESQWIPIDEQLWQVDRYRDFLAARRELLAAAANRVLDGLLHAPAEAAPAPVSADLAPTAAAADTGELVDPEITELLRWVAEREFAAPRIDLEIVDPETQVPIVEADLAWPNGVQEGLSDPVAFELDAGESVVTHLQSIGYRCFTTSESLRRYLESGGELAMTEDTVLRPVSIVAELFHRAMQRVYERARDEAGYNAVRFHQMVSEYGGLDTAHQLLRAPHISDGFTALWEKRRLDLTVEAQVLRPEFAGLFAEDELAVAQERLDAVGYDWREEAS